MDGRIERLIEQLHQQPKPTTIPLPERRRNLDYYRRLLRLAIALCALQYEWRTGEKPPPAKELLE
jgi:hypothetical protein